VEQSGSSLGSIDTKLKSGIAKSTVITRLLKEGFPVLQPVGDRLPYDLAVELNGNFSKFRLKVRGIVTVFIRSAAGGQKQTGGG